MKKLLCFVALAGTATLASCADGGDNSSSFKNALELSVTRDITSIYQVNQPSKVETAVNLSEAITPENKTTLQYLFQSHEKYLGVKSDQELKSTVKDEVSKNQKFTTKVETDLGVGINEAFNYTYYIKNLKNEKVWVSSYTHVTESEAEKKFSDLTFKDSFSAETVYIYYYEASDGTLTEGSSRHLYFSGNGSKISYGDTSATDAAKIEAEGGSYTFYANGLSWSVGKDYKSITNKTKVEIGSTVTYTYNIKNLGDKYKASCEFTLTDQGESGTILQEGYFTVKYEGSYIFTWE